MIFSGPFGHLDRDGFGSCLDRLGQLAIHRNRQACLLRLREHGKRPDGHFPFHSGDHPVGSPGVELEEVGVNVDLGRLEIGVIIIVPLACQNRIDTIIHVGAKNGRILQIVVGSRQTLFFVKHIEKTVFVDNRLFLPLFWREFNREPDEVNIIHPRDIGPFRTETPTTLLARLGRL